MREYQAGDWGLDGISGMAPVETERLKAKPLYGNMASLWTCHLLTSHRDSLEGSGLSHYTPPSPPSYILTLS
mgnify:CR=1 FL=1